MATQLVKYIDTYTTDAHGQVLWSMIDVTGYQQVSTQFSTSLRLPASMTVNCNFGIPGNVAVGATVAQFPLDGPAKIYTFAVVAPLFGIVLTGGPSNKAIQVAGWVFLH